MFAGRQMEASMALGGISLFVSILNTMGSYFGFAKLAEAHRIAGIHYSKLYRFITVEMSLPRDERMNPPDFLKYTKEMYDRLTEISPVIPELVVKEFKEKFADETQSISVPEQMNGLECIRVYSEKDLEEDLEIGFKTRKIEKSYATESAAPTPMKFPFSAKSTPKPAAVKIASQQTS